MSEERLNLIKENVYARCSVANITGIGMTAPDKEEVELIEEIERLNNIIKSAKDLFYEKCRISQKGVYTFNQVDYEELDNVLKGSNSNENL